MNDVMIFAVGLGVMGIVLASAFVALIASDDPERIEMRSARQVPKPDLDVVSESRGSMLVSATGS